MPAAAVVEAVVAEDPEADAGDGDGGGAVPGAQALSAARPVPASSRRLKARRPGLPGFPGVAGAGSATGSGA